MVVAYAEPKVGLGKSQAFSNNVVEVNLTDKYEPFPKQIEAHTCPAQYILYGGAAGGGKSVFLVNEMLALMLEFPRNIGFIGRFEASTFMDTTYIELEEYMPWELVRHHSKDTQKGRYFEFYNGSRLYYGGLRASSGDENRQVTRIKGRKYGAIAWDEATEFPEDIFMHMAVRLRHQVRDGGKIKRPRYKFLLTCNPGPGWLKQRFVDQQLENHAFIRSLPTDNPCLPPDYITTLESMFAGSAGGQVMIDKYIYGLWDLPTTDLVLFSEPDVVAAMLRDVDPGSIIHLGVDVARSGTDKSVIALRQGYKYSILWTCIGADTVELAKQVAMYANDTNASVIKIDAVGIGGGVVDNLRHMKGLKNKVLEFIAGGSPVNPKRFGSMKAEAYWEFARQVSLGLVDIPESTTLKNQLTTMLYDDNNRVIELETKQKRRKRRLESPNEADAIVIASYDGIRGTKKKGKAIRH